MKFTNETYLLHQPFDGDRDIEIRCRKVKVIKVRKSQTCYLSHLLVDAAAFGHTIKPGDMAIRETAIVDGQWGSSWSCLDCMDKWLINEVGIKPNGLTAGG